jgi:hypothetical protein
MQKQEQFIRINTAGDKFYYKDKAMTIRHCLDGPAIECLDGYKVWYADGKRHRLDGPALECVSGERSWFVDGKGLTEEEFIARTSPKHVELTLDQIAEKFGICVDNLKIVK